MGKKRKLEEGKREGGRRRGEERERERERVSSLYRIVQRDELATVASVSYSACGY